jgi:hypothetical protein
MPCTGAEASLAVDDPAGAGRRMCQVDPSWEVVSNAGSRAFTVRLNASKEALTWMQAMRR